jgi:hypothetical protein
MSNTQYVDKGVFMKKILFGIIVIISMIVTGCFSTPSYSNSVIETVENKYEIKESVRHDISGDIVSTSVTIYESDYSMDERTRIRSSTSMLFGKKTLNNTESYQIDVVYVGNSWAFIDNLQMSIDGELFSIDTNNPYRDVNNSNSVTEICTFVIDVSIIEKIVNCNTIIFQINGELKGEPIHLEQEAISAMKSILSL